MSFDNLKKSWGSRTDIYYENCSSLKDEVRDDQCSEFQHKQIQNPGDIYQAAFIKQT
jgi:hypothetical protein